MMPSRALARVCALSVFCLRSCTAAHPCRVNQYVDDGGACTDDPLAQFDLMVINGGDSAHQWLQERFDRNRDGAVSWAEAQANGVRRVHFDYYDGQQPSSGSIDHDQQQQKKNRDGSLDYGEFIKFARQLKLFRSADFAGPAPRGHMRRFGEHADPKTTIDVDDYRLGDGGMRPAFFWRRYVEQHRPLLMKGVALGSKAEVDWTPEYLAQHYGGVDVKVEPKKESRGDGSVYSKYESVLPNHRTNISNFLKIENELGVYAVTILPQSMAWDVPVPPAVLCGGRAQRADKTTRAVKRHPYPNARYPWMTHLLENNLWLGSGRTRSQFHFDKENIVNCLYEGHKRWIMIDTRKYGRHMPWVRGDRYSSEDDLLNAGTDWVAIDPDAVDLRVFSRLQEVDFLEFEQEAGDCVFIPYSMLHYVEKTDQGLGAAVSFMWQNTELYDEAVCATAPLDQTAGPANGPPLAIFDVLWYYSGEGVIPQGYLDPAEEVLTYFASHLGPQGRLTRKYLREWSDGSHMTSRRFKQFWREFLEYAVDGGKILSVDEMWWPPHGNVPLSLWLRFVAEADPEGMLNCDWGYQYIPRTIDDEREIEMTIRNISSREPSQPRLRTAKLEF